MGSFCNHGTEGNGFDFASTRDTKRKRGRGHGWRGVDAMGLFCRIATKGNGFDLEKKGGEITP
jgi:hypothetical protein